MPSFRQQVETMERWERLPGLRRLPPGEPTIVLTFDDGPDPDATPAVLAALGAEEIEATFFLVGEQLARNPRLGRQIVEGGHEAALHGFRHVEHDDLERDAARDDLARGVEAAEAALGVRPRWFRPPFGRFSELSYAACRELGLEPVYWSGWGLDWETITAERIAELVRRDLAGGAIVLLHDSARYASRRTAAPTAGAIPLIAADVRDRGLVALTLGRAAPPA